MSTGQENGPFTGSQSVTLTLTTNITIHQEQEVLTPERGVCVGGGGGGGVGAAQCLL